MKNRKQHNKKRALIPTNTEILHTRRDLLTDVVLPLLRNQGYSEINDVLSDCSEIYGWSNGSGYQYRLFKITNGLFIYLNFFAYLKGRYLGIDMKLFDISPNISIPQNISINNDLWQQIKWVEEPFYLYPGCSKHNQNWWYYRYFVWNFCYRLKFFITRIGFKFRVRQLKKQLIRDFTNVQSIVDICLAERKPDTINFQEQKIIKK